MEQFEIVQKVEGGKLFIELPEKFNNKEVKITVTSGEDFEHEESWADLPGEKRLEILKQFAGTAKFPDADTNKYEVYEQ